METLSCFVETLRFSSRRERHPSWWRGWEFWDAEPARRLEARRSQGRRHRDDGSTRQLELKDLRIWDVLCLNHTHTARRGVPCEPWMYACKIQKTTNGGGCGLVCETRPEIHVIAARRLPANGEIDE